MNLDPAKANLNKAAYKGPPCPECGCSSVSTLSMSGDTIYMCWCCHKYRGPNEASSAPAERRCDIETPHHHYWAHVYGITHYESWTGEVSWTSDATGNPPASVTPAPATE